MKGDSESIAARALYFIGNGRVELRKERVETGAGEEMVISRLIGISHGTELRLFRGEAPETENSDETIASLSGTSAYPMKYGYINVGTSVRGHRVFAFYPHQDVFSCAGKDLVELPPDLSDEDALFLANTETAIGIAHDVHPRYGETGLIAGQGVVGLLTARILMNSGIEKLISLDPVPFRREKSEEAGCMALDPYDPAVRKKIRRETGGRGADFAVNVSGNGSALQLLIDTLAFEAKVIEASWYGTNSIPLSLGGSFHRKRLSIVSSQVSHIGSTVGPKWTKERRIALVLETLKELKPSIYITHRFPFSDAQLAFESIAGKPGEVLQALLIP